MLTEPEAKALCRAYGLPVNDTYLAQDRTSLASVMERVDFPVAMKICSPDIAHKSDAGGVRLDVASVDEALEVFDAIIDAAKGYDEKARIDGVSVQPMIPRPDAELLMGAKQDRLFGPVVMFGLGGIYTEILEEINLGLVPLKSTPGPII